MQALPPSERFLEALSTNSSISHIALPESIGHFYSEALHLCTSFDNGDNSASFPHPYAGLISIFEDIKLAIILNGLSEEYRLLLVHVEQLDFEELSARSIEEERLIKSNGSSDGGSKLA
jgi:hypothetical protein